MDILESIETRWFVEDEGAARALSSWFADVPPEPARVDRYLCTGRDDLGFKARRSRGAQAKIEAKYLVGSLGPLEVAPGITGVLERWTKLSLAADDPRLSQQGTWLVVDKRRQLRKLACTDDGAHEVAPDARPDRGAGLELTALRYRFGGRTRRALTLGLEAFGPVATLLPTFQQAACVAFAGCPATTLSSAQSRSYPSWIARLPRA